MARPYSQDLPDRVVGSVASGRTCRATAVLFGVSVASVVKWSQRWLYSAVRRPIQSVRAIRCFSSTNACGCWRGSPRSRI